jgi:hypothetical protein
MNQAARTSMPDARGASSDTKLDPPSVVPVLQRGVNGALRSRKNTSSHVQVANSIASVPKDQVTQDPQAASSVIQIPNFFKKTIVRGRSINTIQEWEGLVDRVDSDGFEARLRDLTRGDHAQEIAWIPMSEVDRKDLTRVKPGAVFHLIVGFCRRGGGQKRETELYFRKHLPSARKDASDLADLLDFFADDAG